MAPDSGGPIQSTAPEPLLPSLDSQEGMLVAESARIALRRAEGTMKPIDQANIWKGAISNIKWVMDTVSPISEARAISILPLLD